ncbi:hypothetical protein CLIB1423_20S01772 [[Candida] railenensis]|uniref:SP-RING-type domain-containing protein n=1 Tax=[Candida] railenensis TaxID=45579 RepID=A0A9P0QUW2_9ASCO|nr:hypothetical protein CLIB1423_20S01772 [[Candida] railenensis]
MSSSRRSGDFQLPSYLPLHSSLLRKFEKIHSNRPPEYDIISQSINDLVRSTRDYIEYILKKESGQDAAIYVDDTLLTNNLQALESLIRSKYDLDVLMDSTKESRSRIRQDTKEVQPLTIESLQESTNELDVGQNFDEVIISNYNSNLELHSSQSSFRSYLSGAPSYQYVKNVSFILTHPEDPLPDDNSALQTSDDLEVAGGKISLKDPISLQYFKDPVRSKKCLHVFESSTINSMFPDHRSGALIECPTDGCKAQISRQDLEPDELMQLRVRVYLAAK